MSRRRSGGRQARAAALTVAMALALAACASNRERIVLEPGVQLGDAEVDVESGVVTMEREGVGLSVQAAMLPSPRGEALHPTFWVTVRNDREERIVVRPADARLIDTFGNQLAPVPMSVGAMSATPWSIRRSTRTSACTSAGRTIPYTRTMDGSHTRDSVGSDTGTTSHSGRSGSGRSGFGRSDRPRPIRHPTRSERRSSTTGRGLRTSWSFRRSGVPSATFGSWCPTSGREPMVRGWPWTSSWCSSRS